MNKSDISSHYLALSQNYNKVVYSSATDAQYQDQAINLMMEYLELSPSSSVVDLGAGVCTMASALWKKAGLSCPVLCVDPSAAMLEVGRGLPGVITECCEGEDWSMRLGEKVDRVYIRGSWHHFQPDRRQDTVKAIFDKLNPGGRFCIEKPADNFNMLPYPAKVIQLMNSMEPTRDDVMKMMRLAGFDEVQCHRDEFPVEKPKKELFHSFRNRFISGFSMFSDAEIEEGLEEVNAKFPGDTVHFVDVKDFIVAVKQ